MLNCQLKATWSVRKKAESHTVTNKNGMRLPPGVSQLCQSISLLVPCSLSLYHQAKRASNHLKSLRPACCSPWPQTSFLSQKHTKASP